MNIKPIGKRVLVEKIQMEEKTTSGILLLSNDNDKSYSIGKIIALSEDLEINTLFKLNSSIIFKNSSGFEINISNSDYIMLELEEILGIIEN